MIESKKIWRVPNKMKNNEEKKIVKAKEREEEARLGDLGLR